MRHDQTFSRGRRLRLFATITRLLPVLAAAALLKDASASFYIEAGYGGLNLRDERLSAARFGALEVPAEHIHIHSSSEPRGVPFIRGGFNLPMLRAIALEAAYFDVGTLEFVATPIGAGPVSWNPFQQRERIRAWALGPGVNYRFSERLRIAGGVGGLYVRTTQTQTELNAHFEPLRELARTSRGDIRPHGRAVLAYRLVDTVEVLASYTYLDLSPGWNRRADLLGLSLRVSY